MIIDKFFALVTMAILVEAIITYFGEIRSLKSPLVGSLILGIVVALLYGIDLPGLVGIHARIPYVGEVLTGIIMARGSNYLYDLIGRFTEGQ